MRVNLLSALLGTTACAVLAIGLGFVFVTPPPSPAYVALAGQSDERHNG